jgi:tRNA (Thr-GGU) A37 N-methylase
MTDATSYGLVPIGWVRSSLKRRADAPKQGREGAPDARIQIEATFAPGLDRLTPGDDLLIFTWLHQGKREVLAVHPRT